MLMCSVMFRGDDIEIIEKKISSYSIYSTPIYSSYISWTMDATGMNSSGLRHEEYLCPFC